MRGLRLGLSLTGGSAAAFNPASLFVSTAGACYDASDLTTLFQSGTRASPGTPVAADGDPVGLMLDKSGNNNDLVQATSTKRPLWRTGGFIQFDNVDDYMQCALTLSQPYDRYSYIKCGSWTSNDYLFDGSADEAVLRQLTATPGLSQYAGAVGATNNGMTIGTPCAIAEHFEGASSFLNVGATNLATSVGTSGTTFLTLGATGNGGANSDLYMHRLLIRAGTLTAGQATSVLTWLAS